MNDLYSCIGVSKQSVHQYNRRHRLFIDQFNDLLKEADQLREEHPGCGVRKLYQTLQPSFVGRDRFIDVMMNLGYRLKRFKNYKRTTRSSSYHYPNLIQGLTINSPSHVWQSDITYIPIAGKFYYATFIIDVYSKKIVGYHIADNLRAQANVKALQMALKQHKAPLIHHSDRGTQYISKEYTDLLNENNCRISMAKTAMDNAYAERINRTIKEEYLDYWKPKDFKQLKLFAKKAVKNYNYKRIHNHIGTNPNEFEKKWSLLDVKQRPEITIFEYSELLT